MQAEQSETDVFSYFLRIATDGTTELYERINFHWFVKLKM